MNKKTILLFSIKFISIFTMLFILANYQRDNIAKAHKNVFEPWFDHFINDNFQELTRKVILRTEYQDLKFDIVRPNINDLSKNEIKTVSINTINESIIPLILTISLILSFQLDRKKLFMYLGLLILINLFYIYFKYLILVYDNYSFLDFKLIDNLPFLIDKIVYFGNWVLTNTGYSFNIIFPILAISILLFREYDFTKIINN